MIVSPHFNGRIEMNFSHICRFYTSGTVGLIVFDNLVDMKVFKYERKLRKKLGSELLPGLHHQ